MPRRGSIRRKKDRTPPRRNGAYAASAEPPAAKRRARNERLIRELHAAAERYLDCDGVTLTRTDHPDATESIVFSHNGTPLVYVFASKAIAKYGASQPISGDFRQPGEHWRDLRKLLLKLSGSEERAPEPPEMSRTLTTQPSSWTDELAAAALHGSEQIRAELRVYPCPVLLIDSTTGTEIRFEPVRTHPRLLVPFAVCDAAGVRTRGALDLTVRAGLVPVAFGDSVDEAPVEEVWPLALLAFADLVGTGQRGSSVEIERSAHQRRTGAPSDAPRALPKRRAAGRGRRPVEGSSALTPIGGTAGYRGAFVAGYRRHLPRGQSCGGEAREAARIYGIDLGSGWTWVQPHKRGLPETFVLRYAWRMPPQIPAHAGTLST